ncbi:uncharacterized protein DMENIID0001_168610 [Sergentomyia squamirostris]
MANVPKQCLTSVLVRVMVFPYLRAWKSSNIDSIDCFTNELVEKRNSLYKSQMKKYLQDEVKAVKASRKFSMEAVRKNPENYLEIDVRNLQNLLEKSLEQDDKQFQLLLQEAVTWKRDFVQDILLDILDKATEAGKWNVLEKLREICAETHPEFLTKYQGFILNEIRILWQEGNAERSLDKLSKVYKDLLPWNQSEAHRILRLFSRETVGQKSEAILVSLIRVSEGISACGDHFPLEILWRDCFFSRWFSDQEIAGKLFRKHPEIQDFVRKEVKIMVFRLLLKHRLETVYRLIELLLNCDVDMKSSCKDVLMLLFDYQYWRHNASGCSEIFQSSIDLEIPLGADYEKKLVILFLKPRKVVTRPEKPAPTIEYKF